MPALAHCSVKPSFTFTAEKPSSGSVRCNVKACNKQTSVVKSERQVLRRELLASLSLNGMYIATFYLLPDLEAQATNGEQGLRGETELGAAFATSTEETTNPLIQRLLERSKANKEKNDKERLEDYYRRNYKDYFNFIRGGFGGRKNMTAAERDIVTWLESNK